MKKLLTIITLFLSLAFPAYSQTDSHITQDQAIEIARQAFIEQGGNIDWIKETDAVFFNEYGRWAVVLFTSPTQEESLRIGSEVFVDISADGSVIKMENGY